MSENDQFAAVRAALEGIYFEQGYEAYWTCLAQETNDVDGYIAWSLAQPIPAVPTVSAADFLGMLRELNFLDNAAFARVAGKIDNIADGIIPLAVGAKRKLFVAPTPTDLTYEGDVAPQKDGVDGDEDDIMSPPRPAVTPDERIHPWVAKLVLAGEPPQSENPPATPPVRHPQFIYSLGRLMMQDIRPIDEIPLAERRPGQDADISKRPLERTNYVVVVDVARDANKAVWMVYNRAPFDPDIGDYNPSTLPQNDPVVFSGSGSTSEPVPNPDMAMLFSALTAWRIGTETGHGALPSLEEVKGRVEESRVMGEVVVRGASVGEVNQAIAGRADDHREVV